MSSHDDRVVGGFFSRLQATQYIAAGASLLDDFGCNRYDNCRRWEIAWVANWETGNDGSLIQLVLNFFQVSLFKLKNSFNNVIGDTDGGDAGTTW